MIDEWRITDCMTLGCAPVIASHAPQGVEVQMLTFMVNNRKEIRLLTVRVLVKVILCDL